MYPIEKIRKQFLGLSYPDSEGRLPLLLDGPGGSQLPKSVVDVMADYLYHFNSNLGGYAHAGIITSSINNQARKSACIWLNCQEDEVFFGLNATSLMFHVARTLSCQWQEGDNIVVSDIDHFSHVSSWQQAAQDHGVEVRKIPLTSQADELDFTTLQNLIDKNTKLVAISLASNVLGTKTKLNQVVQKARSVNALVSVDAVHAIVHECIDVKKLDCDILFASAYKFGGARLGICYMKKEHLSVSKFYKVEPAADTIPNAWEQGTQSFEAQAGLAALLDYYCSLSCDEIEKRERLKQAYAQIAEHELSLSQAFLSAAEQRDYLCLYGKKTVENRTPTFAFNVTKNGEIIPPAVVSRWFGNKNIALPSGNFYALGVVRQLDLLQTGFLRVGFLHYNTLAEVARFFDLLDEFMTQSH